VHPLEVTLEDLYNGKVTKLALRKNVICTVCSGCATTWTMRTAFCTQGT
jgi:DnaJ-class molecular chaperone